MPTTRSLNMETCNLQPATKSPNLRNLMNTAYPLPLSKSELRFPIPDLPSPISGHCQSAIRIRHSAFRIGLVLCLLHAACCLPLLAQGTAFTYQGILTLDGAPANGLHDLRFTLHNDPVLGSTVGGPVTNAAVPVSNGLFSVIVDLGQSPFSGGARWLQLGVRPEGAPAFTTLAPRQPVTSAPYSLRAAYAGTAVSAGTVVAGGVTTTALMDSSVTSAKIVDGTIVNADISANAGITDTKLGTIATAGKVANSATTATSTNVPNTIVARDPLGAFAVTTLRADVIESASTNLEVRVNNQRVMQMQYPPSTLSPNLVGGYFGNRIDGGTVGSVIAGGGIGGTLNEIRNDSDYSAISGGYKNGILSDADGSTIAGGWNNTIGEGDGSSIVGGAGNQIAYGASYSTVLGGINNYVSGSYSLAAGSDTAVYHAGSFVWADAQGATFSSTAPNQFLIRAAGGVGINTASPQASLDVNGSFRVGGGTVHSLIQSGQSILTNGSATARTNLTVAFPKAFTSVPRVLATAAADPGWNVDDTFAVSVRQVTTTNVVFNIMRVDSPAGWAQWLRINWQAWQ